MPKLPPMIFFNLSKIHGTDCRVSIDGGRGVWPRWQWCFPQEALSSICEGWSCRSSVFENVKNQCTNVIISKNQGTVSGFSKNQWTTTVVDSENSKNQQTDVLNSKNQGTEEESTQNQGSGNKNCKNHQTGKENPKNHQSRFDNSKNRLLRLMTLPLLITWIVTNIKATVSSICGNMVTRISTEYASDGCA